MGITYGITMYNHRTSPRRWCPSFPAPKWSRWWPTLVKHRRRRKGYRKVGEKWWQNARNPKFHLALAAQMRTWWLYHGLAQKNGDLLPFRHAFTKKTVKFTIFTGIFPPKRWHFWASALIPHACLVAGHFQAVRHAWGLGRSPIFGIWWFNGDSTKNNWDINNQL